MIAGSGRAARFRQKMMTAAALAGELKLPLFMVVYDGLIGKLKGETAIRLPLVFEVIAAQCGVSSSTSSTPSVRSGRPQGLCDALNDP